MAARAYWQGHIKLALVSFAVEAYPATRSGRAISFNQIHEPSGKRIRYEKVVPGVGPVDPDEIVKGYEVSKGSYVLIDDEEIDAVRIESRKTFDLVQFVEKSEIDVRYVEKPYYVVPADALSEEAYVVLREALRETGMVGLGQLAVRGREQLVALQPCGAGLAMVVLRYGDEISEAKRMFAGISEDKPDPDLLDLATTLIEKRTGPFEPERFKDNYVDALHALIERKVKSGSDKRILEDVLEPSDVRGGSNVIDLMAALRKSVEQGGGKEKKAKVASPAKRAPARRKRA